MKRELLYIAIIAGFIAWTVRGCFTKEGKTYEMGVRDEKIKGLEQNRIKDSIVYSEREQFYDSLLSLSGQRYQELENKKQTIYNVINKVRPAVDNFDKEQLRSSITNNN